jgi:hypothetical protein
MTICMRFKALRNALELFKIRALSLAGQVVAPYGAPARKAMRATRGACGEFER